MIPPKGTMARDHAELLVRCRQLWREIGRSVQTLLDKIAYTRK